MTQPKALSSIMQWSFAALMLGLTGLFIYLGTWQVHRLAEKEALIASVAARLDQRAIAVPDAAQWPTLDAASMDFQPVTLSGTLHADQTIRIFTSLVDGRGPAGGPGYWIVTPLQLASGGSVFVNQGFVPEAQSKEFTGQNGSDVVQTVTITGLLRPAEAASMFTPAANAADRIDWVRDPTRLALMVDPQLGPFAPFYVDAAANPAGGLPQGGETVVEFPNNHLGYALTWYGFALITPIMLGFWLWRQRQRAA